MNRASRPKVNAGPSQDSPPDRNSPAPPDDGVIAWHADDDGIERRQAAIDARLAPYRDRRYATMPDDPRRLDPVRLAALRDRMMDRYAYRWRAVEAVDEIMDALFEPIPQHERDPMTLTVQSIHLDDQGNQPHPFQHGWDDDFKKYYYITVCSLRPGDFLNDFEEAERLIQNILPGWNYTIHAGFGGARVAFKHESIRWRWFSAGDVPSSLVTAALDLLARHPEVIKPWRTL